ncbi:MAG: hypothetical protein AAF264_03965, partial [Pseudomonadota bacterium]
AKAAHTRDVETGDPVVYTITGRNESGIDITTGRLVDTLPVGFAFQEGTARLNGEEVATSVSGRVVTIEDIAVADGGEFTVTMIAVVGAGVAEGEHTNRARLFDALSGLAISNAAEAVVRRVPSPVFDCSDIIGKVFDDLDGDGHQDEGERGLSNVTIATVRGVLITTDAFGRWHVPCAEVPAAGRGSNFVAKLDESTLPFGYALTTPNPSVERITRGRLSRINFGAAVYRLMEVDLSAEAFDGGVPSRAMREGLPHVAARLVEAPTVLRLIHPARGPGADRELRTLGREVARAYERVRRSYPLRIEYGATGPDQTGSRGTNR